MQEQLSFKERLEHIYDVPFVTESGILEYDPWFTISPQSEDQSLFTIRLTFRNALRLIMDFEPQKYGTNLVRSMGMAGAEQKLVFCSYARMMSENGGKIDFAINNLYADPLSSDNWPDKWSKVRIHVTIIPISDQDNSQEIPYTDIANEWGCLMMGMVLSLLDIVPLDGSEDAIAGYEEGNKTEVMANRYERNPINRFLSLKKYGYQCQVCGFDFALTYGDIGQEFIHVHHIVPVSQMGDHYIVDPLTDLVPVCPNCHAMLHKKDPPFSIADLKSRIGKI
jgi:Predicted restriction endonuclease